MSDQTASIPTRVLVVALVVLTLVVAASAWVGSWARAYDARPVPVSAELVASRVVEDHPSWDCATMGNRRCGPGNRHPRTGQRIPAGAYERVPRALWGQRVERAGSLPGTRKVTRRCVRHVRDGSPFVCPRSGVLTS